MRLYYTTAGDPETQQGKPTNSLGGFKSSSQVPNDQYSNLFGELSTYSLSKMQDEYIGLMLVNETGGDITGVNIYFDIPEGSYSEYKIDAITPATDEDGNKYVEQIPSRYSKPLYSTPITADVDNKYSIGDMLDGAMVGVWVKREIDEDFINEDCSNVYEKDSNNERLYVPVEKTQEDSINIIIEWD